LGETGDVDASYLAALLKNRIQKLVGLYEQDTARASADAGLDSF